MVSTAMFLLVLVIGIFLYRDGRLGALWNAFNGSQTVKGAS